MSSILPLPAEYANYDLVIGIPFFSENRNLPALIESLDEVLQQWIGRRYLIVCVGDHYSDETLHTIQGLTLKHLHLEFLMPPEISGRGMCIRALLEIAKIMEADLIIFSANMGTATGPGIDLTWLENLITPIQGVYDLVVGSMRRYFGIDSIAHQFTVPILESFYGSRMGDPLGGIYAIDHTFIEELAGEAKFWTGTINGFGFDFWLITRALVWDKKMCEVNLGGVSVVKNLERRNRIFYETAVAVSEAIKRDTAIWMKDRLVIKVVDVLTRSEVVKPDIIENTVSELLQVFRRTNTQFMAVINQCLPQNMAEEISKISGLEPSQFYLSDEIWVTSVLNLLINYVFDEEIRPSESLQALTALYNGRLASYAIQMNSFQASISTFPAAEQDDLMVHKMDSIRQHLTEEFWRQKPEINKKWLSKTEQAKPPLIPLGYMEYVPGRPIVVPKKIMGKDQRLVQVDTVFRALRRYYEDEFNRFIVNGLGLPKDYDSCGAIAAVANFMDQTEKALDQLLPGDMATTEGIEQFTQKLFALLPPQHMLAVKADVLRGVLTNYPPLNLMIPLGYNKISEMIADMDVRDALSYANLVEVWSYSDSFLATLLAKLRPTQFETIELKPLLITNKLPFSASSHTRISNLNRITGRVTIKTMEAGRGGKYPKLSYFTSIIRRLGIAQQFSSLLNQIVQERKNIGSKTRNALLSLRQGEEFSANTIFENVHHRTLVKIIRDLATRLERDSNHDLARILQLMADGYGLSQVLENGIFLTSTVWSWAAYSYKGGLKIPGPLTTSVEARWFNHDFLEHMYRELGYGQDELMQTVYRLIQAGKGDKNLLDTLMPARPNDVAVVVQEATDEPSKTLQRYAGNPLLEPIADHAWESKYVLNPGAIRIEDKVYLFYRAVGEDEVSRIGLAITDGYRVLERLSQPIFGPIFPEESMGCEDPRLVIIDDRIWMLYTAYDGSIAQIAIASITTEDFLNRRYDLWEREGFPFKNIWDKDGIIFPEKIQGRYIVYHRIEPSMWITYMNELVFPFTEKHAIILGPRPGRMWDSQKIGAGAPPLKTKYGWLLVYHGVDYNYIYRLGIILVDLLDPQRIIYRSPNPVLEPEEYYELGESGAWVPNVVFTCGAVCGSDKAVLEDADEILVYYGAADTSIGMAKATVADLIPAKYRTNGK